MAHQSRHRCRRQRTLSNLLRELHVPEDYPLHWTQQTSVVYLRVTTQRQAWYVGSTRHTIHDREQSRYRKFLQLCSDRTAYFEPALRYWQTTKTFHVFVPIVIAHEPDEDALRSLESTFIQRLQPRLNHPLVHAELKRQGLPIKFIPTPNSISGDPGRRQHRKRKYTIATMGMDETGYDIET